MALTDMLDDATSVEFGEVFAAIVCPEATGTALDTHRAMKLYKHARANPLDVITFVFPRKSVLTNQAISESEETKSSAATRGADKFLDKFNRPKEGLAYSGRVIRTL